MTWYVLELSIYRGASDSISELAFSQDTDKLKAFAQEHSTVRLKWGEDAGGLWANGKSGATGYYQYRIMPTNKQVLL